MTLLHDARLVIEWWIDIPGVSLYHIRYCYDGGEETWSRVLVLRDNLHLGAYCSLVLDPARGLVHRKHSNEFSKFWSVNHHIFNKLQLRIDKASKR